MTDIEGALQATVQKALSSVSSSRWTLDEAGRRDAYTLTVQPTDPAAATVAVTLYGPQITVDVADLLSVELALEDEVEDLAYIARSSKVLCATALSSHSLAMRARRWSPGPRWRPIESRSSQLRSTSAISSMCLDARRRCSARTEHGG
jgi:hypothetical protein